MPALPKRTIPITDRAACACRSTASRLEALKTLQCNVYREVLEVNLEPAGDTIFMQVDGKFVIGRLGLVFRTEEGKPDRPVRPGDQWLRLALGNDLPPYGGGDKPCRLDPSQPRWEM